MKTHIVKLKQSNMLCHRCVLNVVKALSQIQGIQELSVNLEEKRIKIAYNDQNVSREMIKEIVDEAIIKGKVKKLP
ncbi:MAG: copper chaperone [Petroclostridium sp.]|uniref:heavy-metal-associated domain-containing protein n=1 Tax=Petroclostridium xylanilyticum TaxID=1792311 RepID=UPI000B99CD24|nr:heavy metal-associated domain-containing protein [Petroclostridium xylanilyticum]MBZ4646630.1 copper resistance protein CopZ [Clostridia bacterium]MDK2809463.1 copper chaperone [Petroclostridium sp.]